MIDYYKLLQELLRKSPDASATLRRDMYMRAEATLIAHLKGTSPSVEGDALDQHLKLFRDARDRCEAEQQAASEPAQQEKPSPAAGATPKPQARRIADSDYDFLPAALEILETPPSPVRMRMMSAICAFVVAALAWSYFGHFDIVAVAQGKFQPTGRVNIVQPIETGKVKSIKVTNGSRVKEGDLLVEMDPSDAQSDLGAATAILTSSRAEVERRTLAEELISARKPLTRPISWSVSIPADVRAREQKVFDADMAQLWATVTSLDAQRSQKRAEEARIASTISAQELYVRTLQERVDMREALVAKAAGARSNVIDALEKLNEQQTQLAAQRGQLKEVAANLLVIDREIEKVFQMALADNGQKLVQAQRLAEEAEQRVAKMRVRVANTSLRSPSSGTVQALAIINPGQVSAAGEQILRIVPDDVGLEIEGYVQNKDIGFIKEGQDAIIKVESFPFTKWGTIDAKVIKVARDAIPLPEAAQAEASPSTSQRLMAGAGAQRTQNLVYQVTLKPLQDRIGSDADSFPLMAGMAVTLEVKTGQRRIISYLLTPLVELGSTAMRER